MTRPMTSDASTTRTRRRAVADLLADWGSGKRWGLGRVDARQVEDGPMTTSGETPGESQGSRRRWRLLVVDVLGPALFAAVFLFAPTLLGATVTGPDATLTIVSALALTQARRRPLVGLAVTVAATFVGIIGGWQTNGAQLAMSLAVFAFALRRPRLQAVVAAAVATLVFELISLLARAADGSSLRREDVIIWLWMLTTIAVVIQARRSSIAALQERARRAEETQEATARQRVADDRLRIARELHDVMAHHVAVITVQAGVAEHLMRREPDAASDALHHVRQAARSVLEELQSVLRVLRQDETDQPATPVPDLAALEDLVVSFRRIGIPVELRLDAPTDDVPAPVGLVVYRLVEEALTNVHKHAMNAPASVSLTHHTDALELSVTNAPPPPGPHPSALTGSGFGLIGMRERVQASGGQLTTGATPDGGYAVRARFPVRTQEDA